MIAGHSTLSSAGFPDQLSAPAARPLGQESLVRLLEGEELLVSRSLEFAAEVGRLVRVVPEGEGAEAPLDFFDGGVRRDS